MDSQSIPALIGAGLAALIPIIMGAVKIAAAIVLAASAVNAAMPQPKPGSHWIPLRKLVNMAALAIAHGKVADDPAFSSWLVRLAVALASMLPPPPPPAPAPTTFRMAVPVEPVITTPVSPPPPAAFDVLRQAAVPTEGTTNA